MIQCSPQKKDMLAYKFLFNLIHSLWENLRLDNFFIVMLLRLFIFHEVLGSKYMIWIQVWVFENFNVVAIYRNLRKMSVFDTHICLQMLTILGILKTDV